MPTKKIWIFAILFGLIMSFLFFMLTLNRDDTELTIPDEEAEEVIPKTESATEELAIETGKRAMTISVDEVQSVSAFVNPGSIVDIVSVYDDGTSQILLENVKVLAVGNRVGAPDEDNDEPYETVTLELTPKDGATLALAKEYAYITLMLRDGEDLEKTDGKNISLEQLREEERANGS